MRVPRDHLRRASRNAAEVLDLLIRLSGETEASVSRAVGLTRAMIRLKRTTAGWYLDDALIFGEAFDIPPTMFFEPADEVHRWLLDNARSRPKLRTVQWAIDAASTAQQREGARRVSTCNPRHPRSASTFSPLKTPLSPKTLDALHDRMVRDFLDRVDDTLGGDGLELPPDAPDSPDA